MKSFFTVSLSLFFMIKMVNLMAQSQTINFFDENQGILVLPEISIIPKNNTFSVTLRQVNSQEFTVVLERLTPIKNSFGHYDPADEHLYLPHLTIGAETYKNVVFELVKPITDPPKFRLAAAEIDKTVVKTVIPTVETKPVLASGDAADDSAIWIHPADPAKSTIIGTQKQAGLVVYDLTGKQLQYLKEGRMNNIDLRYHFPLGDETVTIVAASNRSNNSIAVYKVNPKSRLLENVAARKISVGLKQTAYGLCLYHSALSNKYYVFINDKGGAVEQWEIFDDGHGLVDAKLVRDFRVESQVEGCVADDVQGFFYLGEERLGIWKFSAEPEGQQIPYLIDTVIDRGGHITADVEGLTLFYINETEGYLLASNQGNDTFTVYSRTGNNEFLGQFKIMPNDDLKIDGVSDTDGIDVVNTALSDAFPYGVFVAQDGDNDETQNFKLVPWEHIAQVLRLKKDSSYRLR